MIRTPGIKPPEGTVTVHLDDEPLTVRPGVSIAAALTGVGVVDYRHSAAGDRGLFCGMGVCGECALVVDGVPGRLACTTAVRDGMRLERQPRTPDVDLSLRPATDPEERVDVEVLVVGGGPAGLAAAATAAGSGAQVLLVDERASLGGQYYKQPAAAFTVDPGRLDAQYRAGRTRVERVRAAGVRVLTGTQIWGADGPRELYASGPDRRWIIRAQRVVLATGAYERAVPFPGWTLPGVLTTGAGQSLLRSYQVAPGSRVLVSGNGPLNLQLAAELTRAGATVVALVELGGITEPKHAADVARMAAASPGLVRDGARYLATLTRARVQMLSHATVVRVEGAGRAERAVVARIASDGRPVPGSERSYDVDAVCVGLGFLPGNEIARIVGVDHTPDLAGAYVIDRTPEGRTGVENVWVVGDGAEVRGAKVAQNAGVLAGADVAASLGHTPDAAVVRNASRLRARHERFQAALWRTYAAPLLHSQLAEADTVVCRCESVRLETIDAALDGVQSSGAIKRLTRTGMGHCQGRFCGFVVDERVGRAGQGGPVGFAPQPPFRPMPLAALAAADEE